MGLKRVLKVYAASLKKSGLKIVEKKELVKDQQGRIIATMKIPGAKFRPEITYEMNRAEGAIGVCGTMGDVSKSKLKPKVRDRHLLRFQKKLMASTEQIQKKLSDFRR